ncbi:hypothetical protein T484DRAFT_1776289 [Baffinella frigidus]|nr:hypothetical protein T484DRAFT_1776289 [Cryptophyta sp. CCMP2293]
MGIVGGGTNSRYEAGRGTNRAATQRQIAKVDRERQIAKVDRDQLLRVLQIAKADREHDELRRIAKADREHDELRRVLLVAEERLAKENAEHVKLQERLTKSQGVQKYHSSSADAAKEARIREAGAGAAAIRHARKAASEKQAQASEKQAQVRRRFDVREKLWKAARKHKVQYASSLASQFAEAAEEEDGEGGGQEIVAFERGEEEEWGEGEGQEIVAFKRVGRDDEEEEEGGGQEQKKDFDRLLSLVVEEKAEVENV